MKSLFPRSQPSMLEGSVWRSIVLFAIPIFLGNLFQQLYSTADAFIVGNFISKEALAAVSSSGNLIFMLTGLLNGVAMGAGVLIAKYYGAKDRQSLSLAVHTGIAFAIAAGLVMTALGVWLAPQILCWMGTPEEVLPNSVAYFRTYFYGVLASFVYNIATGILQSVGDSRHPLYYLVVASVVNVVLDLFFVAILHLGVAWAAVATVISQVVSAVLCLRRLMLPDQICRLEWKKVRFDLPSLKDIVRFGLPSGIQNSVIGFANVVVQSNINAFGADAMAGCGSYSKVEGFAFLPVTCFAMALSTYVGQNLGAKQHDRTLRGARFGILCSVTLAEVVGLAIWLFAPHIIALFNDDPSVVAFGRQQARVEGLFYCFLALSHCMAGIFRGAGKATVPMVVMLGIWCIVRVAYITVTVGIWENILLVFSAYPLTWFLSSVIFVIYFFKADWLHAFDRLDERRTSL